MAIPSLEGGFGQDNERLILEANKISKKIKKARSKTRKGKLSSMTQVHYDEDGLSYNDDFGVTFSKHMIDNATGLLKTRTPTGKGLRDYANKNEPTMFKLAEQILSRR